MLIAGFLPAAVARDVMVARKTRRKLAPGELWYDRTMFLAHQANVPVKRVIEVWSASPNAGATMYGDVRLTRGLINKFEPDEVDAVIA